LNVRYCLIKLDPVPHVCLGIFQKLRPEDTIVIEPPDIFTSTDESGEIGEKDQGDIGGRGQRIENQR
jgi:hypothetical protein